MVWCHEFYSKPFHLPPARKTDNRLMSGHLDQSSSLCGQYGKDPFQKYSLPVHRFPSANRIKTCCKDILAVCPYPGDEIFDHPFLPPAPLLTALAALQTILNGSHLNHTGKTLTERSVMVFLLKNVALRFLSCRRMKRDSTGSEKNWFLRRPDIF